MVIRVAVLLDTHKNEKKNLLIFFKLVKYCTKLFSILCSLTLNVKVSQNKSCKHTYNQVAKKVKAAKNHLRNRWDIVKSQKLGETLDKIGAT